MRRIPSVHARNTKARHRKGRVDGSWSKRKLAAVVGSLSLVFLGVAPAAAQAVASSAPQTATLPAALRNLEADGAELTTVDTGEQGAEESSGQQLLQSPANQQSGAPQGNESTDDGSGLELQDGPEGQQPDEDDGAQSGDLDLPQSGESRTAQRSAIAPLAALNTPVKVTVDARTVAQPGSVGATVGPNGTLTTGAKFVLSESTDGSNPVAECTIVSGGTCDLLVTDSEQLGKSYWVVQTAAATGTYFSPLLNLGDSTTPDRDTYIPGKTPVLQQGTDVVMPRDAVPQRNNATIEKSFGSVAFSMNNPAVALKCEAGLDIAVVLDVSTSMNTNVTTNPNVTRLRKLKDTFTNDGGVLDQMKDGPNRLAFFNFSTNSPGTGSPTWNMPTPVSITSANIDTYKSRINNLTANGYTNWDKAMREVAGAATNFDLVVFVTDGAPNYILNGTSVDGANVTLRSLEAAIYSANAVKAQHTRVIAYGIANLETGAGADKARQNLRSISGPTAGEDYFVADTDALMAYLDTLFGALACQSSITVEKYQPGATPGTWTAKSGWQMSVEADLLPGDVQLIAPGAVQTVTNDAGKTGAWTIPFGQEDQTASVIVSEESRAGWQSAAPAEYVKHNVIANTTSDPAPLPDNGAIGGLAPGDQVTVKFYNEEITNPWVEKDFVSVTPNTDPTKPEDFTVVYSVAVHGSNQDTTYSLKDIPGFPEGVTLLSGAAWQIDNLTDHNVIWGPESITSGADFVTDRALPANAVHYYHVEWQVEVNPDISPDVKECSEPIGSGKGYYNTATLTVGSDSTSDDACGDIDATVMPRVTKVLADGSPSQNADGSWTINYNVTVTLPTDQDDNPAGMPADYSLTDNLLFGGGITVDSASWTGQTSGTFSGTQGVLVPEDDRETVTVANPQHVYNVTVKATIDPEQIDETTTSCQPTQTNPDAGFLNRVTLRSSGATRQAQDCDVPVVNSPTVAKSALAPVKNADGSWKIGYQVRVTNASDADLYYSLSDDFKELPSGVSWRTDEGNPVPWAVAHDVTSATGSITVNPGWNGSGTLATGQIKAQATAATVHTFTLTRDVVLGVDTDFQDLLCDQGEAHASGFWNQTTVTNHVTSDGPKWACASIETPRFTVDKNWLSTTPLDDGTWQVDYSVDVTNTGNTSGSFGLVEAPNFGDGFTVVQQGWVSPGGQFPWTDEVPGDLPPLGEGAQGAPGTGTGSEYLLAGFTASYQYRVVASYNPAESSDNTLVCGADGDTRGAFMNKVDVVSTANEDSDFDCAEPEFPELGVTKTHLTTTQDSDGTWEVTYRVSVENDSDVRGIYSLSDTLRFGEGISVTATWVDEDEDGALPTDFAGNSAVLATDRLIAAGATHNYIVVARATIPNATWDDPGTALTCPEPGSESDGAFLNTAELTYLGGTSEVEDCDAPSLPAVTKSFIGAAQSDGDPDQWLVTYQLEVQGGQHDTFYDLADTPEFAVGATPVSGTAQLQGSDEAPVAVEPGVAFVTDVPLPKGATHTYTVVWLVQIDGVIDSQFAECAPESDSPTGFFNLATLTVGDFQQTDDTCGNIEEGVVPLVEKTEGTATQDPDTGEWTSTYTVTVTLPTEDLNPDGLSAKYDLVDTLAFGEGLTVNSGNWTGPGGTSGAFSQNEGLWSSQLASGVTITPEDEQHVYAVTVKADAAALAFEGGNYDCVLQQGEEGTGFLNHVLLTSGGTENTDSACLSPTPPEKPVPPAPKPPAMPKTGAAIGGGVLAGLLLLAAGGALVARNRREHRTRA